MVATNASLSDLARRVAEELDAHVAAEGLTDVRYLCDAEGTLRRASGVAWPTADIEVTVTVRGPAARQSSVERLLRSLRGRLPPAVRLRGSFHPA